jgi:hypothetical protein
VQLLGLWKLLQREIPRQVCAGYNEVTTNKQQTVHCVTPYTLAKALFTFNASHRSVAHDKIQKESVTFPEYVIDGSDHCDTAQRYVQQNCTRKWEARVWTKLTVAQRNSVEL